MKICYTPKKFSAEISAFLEAQAIEADRAAGVLAEKADEARS